MKANIMQENLPSSLLYLCFNSFSFIPKLKKIHQNIIVHVSISEQGIEHCISLKFSSSFMDITNGILVEHNRTL